MEKNFEVADLLGQGVAYTVMGICIVFLILIIIMFVIKAMALFSAEKPAKVSEEKPAPAAEVAEPAPEPDDLELVAVITAAIAASLNKSASSITVKSYKKVASWNGAGRREVLENRF